MSKLAICSKKSDSLIRSFLVSDLSDSLTIAHFLWATWANRSWSLILVHIVYFIRTNFFFSSPKSECIIHAHVFKAKWKRILTSSRMVFIKLIYNRYNCLWTCTVCAETIKILFIYIINRLQHLSCKFLKSLEFNISIILNCGEYIYIPIDYR